MKIAFVTPYLPDPPDTGGKIRTFYLLQGLCRDHAVDLFTVYSGPAPNPGEALRKACHKIVALSLPKNTTNRSLLLRSLTEPMPRLIDHFHSRECVAEVRRQLQERQYDLLVLDEICMAPYLLGIPGAKLALRHKIDHRHYQEINSALPSSLDKLAGWVEVQKLRRYERAVTSQLDLSVCCSEEDAAIVKKLNPSVATAIIGNGVDLERFVPKEEYTGPPTLLFTGTMHYYPNIDAVLYFFREIYFHLVRRIPEIKIHIVGHQPPPEILAFKSLPGVTITGSVPDVRPHLEQCTATFVPLRLGGGTRLKIMESMAAARPVVSTSIGAQGLWMRHREHLLIADDPVQFAEEAAELLRNRELRKRLVGQARPYVAECFSWQVLGEKFEAVCREVARRGTS